jgi:hypothetical protein
MPKKRSTLPQFISVTSAGDETVNPARRDAQALALIFAHVPLPLK